jgi:hypothetical protein
MQCIIYKIYFWKVFHICYNLICIFICTPICTKKLFLQKVGVTPMHADDWLKTTEKKLQVVQCNNRENVLFALHQLDGPAVDWWYAYVEAHEEPESINW